MAGIKIRKTEAQLLAIDPISHYLIFWLISKKVVINQGKMDWESKQNGHPVIPKCIWFNDQEKPYTKEACHVRTHYNTLFPFSSNQNSQSDGELGDCGGLGPLVNQ